MERFRTFTSQGDTIQWVDEELCMILDKVTGKPIRFAGDNEAIGTLYDAKSFLSMYDYSSGRYVVALLSCVSAYKV